MDFSPCATSANVRIAALGDAVILRKEPVFPLGARVTSDIPAKPIPIRAGTLVTRGTLKAAIASGQLIRLTTELLPVPAVTEVV